MNAATRTLLASCIALAIALPAAAQAVYSWKDAKGVTHYSDAPPPKGTTTKGPATKREIAAPAPTSASANTTAKGRTEGKAGEKDRHDEKADKTDKADAAATPKPAPPQQDPAQVAATRAANCKTAQDNLAMLNSYAPVGVDKDGDGKTDEVFSAEQRTAQTQNMQAAVTANCTTP